MNYQTSTNETVQIVNQHIQRRVILLLDVNEFVYSLEISNKFIFKYSVAIFCMNVNFGVDSLLIFMHFASLSFCLILSSFCMCHASSYRLFGFCLRRLLHPSHCEKRNTITDILAISTFYEFLNEWVMEANMAAGRADSNLEDFRVRANQGQCPRE